MDDARFDALTKNLGRVHTRRGLARLLGGLTLAEGLSALGAGETLAATRKGGAPCTRNGQCKSGKCVGPVGSKQCSCTRKFKACVQPDEPCKQATCDFDTKLCVTSDITTGECAEGTCQSQSDCCPAGRPNCASETGFVFKTCVEGNCVCESANQQGYPYECTFEPNPSQCHQCCISDDCARDTEDPDRVCLNGNCVCEGDKPHLCNVWDTNKTRCTNTLSDPEHCDPFGSCNIRCSQGFKCVNGSCVFQSGG
jgi:hypothetical protein